MPVLMALLPGGIWAWVQAGPESAALARLFGDLVLALTVPTDIAGNRLSSPWNFKVG